MVGTISNSGFGKKRTGRDYLSWAVVAGASTAALAGAPAFAADAGAGPDKAFTEIIVTAQKRQEGINNVPMSITAATGEQLVQRGIKEPRDLAKIVPGLTFAESNLGTPILTLRGIGFSDFSMGGRPTVSIYVDEAPIPFAIETRGAGLDLERVEVLKGPQGTLFGQNATGGAINYVAAKPTDIFKAGMNASYGRFGETKLAGFVSGPLTDKLRARVAVERDFSDGWQVSTTHGRTNGRDNFVNGRLLLDWQPTDALKVALNVNGWIDRSDTQAGQLVAVEIAPSLQPVAAAFLPQLLTLQQSPQTARAADFDPGRSLARDNKFFQTNLRIDFTLPNEMTLTSLTSYNRFTEDQPVDGDGTSLHNNDLSTIGRIYAFSQELRLSGDIGSKGHFVVGANFARDVVLQTDFNDVRDTTLGKQFLGLGLPAFQTLRSFNDQRSTTKAVFANVDIPILSTLKIDAGVRYTDYKDSFRGCSGDPGDGNVAAVFAPFWNVLRIANLGLAPVGPNDSVQVGGCATTDAQYVPVKGAFVDRLKEDNVSWRIGAEWKPAENSLVYANISKGYKAGGYSVVGATQTLQLKPARQESVLAYEAGFKTALLARRLQLNAALFYYDYRDKQILGSFQDPVLGPLYRLVNVPKSEVRGAEVQAILTPAGGLTIATGLSYVKSKVLGNFSETNVYGSVQNFIGNSFPNTPKWQSSTDIDYRLSITESLRGFVGAAATYQSRTSSQLGNLPLLVTKAYTLIDLRAGVEAPDGRWRFSLWGRNVGNSYYWSATNHTNDTTSRFTGKPATYGATFAYRFH